jgi:hypothetical protein
MREHTKKLGLGSASIPLILMGLVWSWSLSLGGFCVGDWTLNAVGLRAWSQQGNMGAHYTVYYSLLFFIAAFVLGYRHKDDFGAKTGKVASLVISTAIVLFMALFAVL